MLVGGERAILRRGLPLQRLLQTVIKQLEFFHVGEYADCEPKKDGILKFGRRKQILCGRAAVMKEWQELGDRMAKGEMPTLESLQVFRAYLWLLTKEQEDTLGEAIRAALKAKQQTQTLKQLTDAGGIGEAGSSGGGKRTAVKSQAEKTGVSLQVLCGPGGMANAQVNAGHSASSGSASSASAEPNTPNIYRFFLGKSAGAR